MAGRHSRAGGGPQLVDWSRDHQGRAGFHSSGRTSNSRTSRPEALVVQGQAQLECATPGPARECANATPGPARECASASPGPARVCRSATQVRVSIVLGQL